jgi:ABC-type transport system involved in cytochrome c biogenesis permease component
VRPKNVLPTCRQNQAFFFRQAAGSTPRFMEGKQSAHQAMTFLPIVERELRLKSRRTFSYLSRCAVALVAALMSLGSISLSLSAGGNPTEIGQNMFWAFSPVAFAYALLAGPIFTADCLSEEKREGTLGLLFLTDLKGYDVVLGKLVATSLPAAYSLLAAIPILALSFFLGGVTAGEFWRMTQVLFTTLLFSLAAGLFISSISRNGRRAFLASALVILITVACAPLGKDFSTNFKGGWFVPLLLVPSPLVAITLVSDGKYAIAAAEFARTLINLDMASLGLLVLASVLLPRSWQERAVGTNTASETDPGAPGKHFSVPKRKTRSRKLLENDPAQWLAAYASLSPALLTVFWILSFTLWIAGFLELRSRSLPPQLVFLTVYFLHASVKCWVAWEASRRFAEDRRSGALELLLTTPLNDRAILMGWLVGLKRRFIGPVILLLGMDLLLWWGAGDSAWLVGMLFAMGLFVADSYTLCLAGSWSGLTSKNSTQACLRAIGYVLVFPWVLFLAVLGVWGVLLSGSNSAEYFGWLVAIWFLVGYVWDFAMCAGSIVKLSMDFRSVAACNFETGRTWFNWRLLNRKRNASVRV